MRPVLSTVAPLGIALRRARTAVDGDALWTVVAIAATVGLSTLDTIAVNVALPTLERDLDAPVAEGAWMVSSFFLAVLAFVVVAGRVADQFGRRRTLMFGTAVFTGASLLCAIAPDAGWLIAGRAAQGVGAAFMVAPARAVIVNAFPRAHWGRALGATTALASATVFAGPILAGAVIDAASWRWVFLINLPLAALALWLLASKVAESRDPTARRALEVRGAAVLATAMTLVVLGLLGLSGEAPAGLSPAIALGAGVVLLIAFWGLERRTAVPLIDFNLLRRRNFALGCVVKLASRFALLGLLIVVLLFEQDVLGYSALGAGASIIPLMGTALVVGPAGGLAVDRWGTTGTLFSGLVLMAGALALLLDAGTGTPYGRLLFAFIAVGVGCEVLSMTTNVMALGAVGREKAGQASGMLSLFRRGGGLLGVVLAALVFSLVARAELTARLDRPPPLPHATHARLEADLDAYASDAQFSRSHRGVGARVVGQGSATGFRSVVLMCLLVVVVTTLVTLVVWLR
jgi:EmrB/QacA subfamily drug resistance transporter